MDGSNKKQQTLNVNIVLCFVNTFTS